MKSVHKLNNFHYYFYCFIILLYFSVFSFRRKRNIILDDNCCLCYLSGVKYLSKLSEEDILFASFKNHLCEVCILFLNYLFFTLVQHSILLFEILQIPFCVMVDHKTASIVVTIRGSLSLRDIITDFAAASDSFECPGVPPGSTVIFSLYIKLIDLIMYRVNFNGCSSFFHDRRTIYYRWQLLRSSVLTSRV